MLAGFLVTAFVLFATTYGTSYEFSYDSQVSWPGVCNSNNNARQSPINIQTSSVTENSNLTNLQFGDGWTTPLNGTFKNGGHNVQFDPSNTESPAVLTTITPLGTYRVLQMHMHWGRDDSQGSEHTVNDKQYPLELHFVHQNVEQTDTLAGDRLAVIGVFARAVSEDISGVWAQLNASAIREHPSSIPVTNFVYNSLLPTSREYYHYIGSLTTPGCDEVVQWFVLKDPIDVPAQYLVYLRQVQSSNTNETLTFNFRDVQALGQRSVYTVGSDAPGSGAPKVVLSAFVMLIAAIAMVCFS